MLQQYPGYIMGRSFRSLRSCYESCRCLKNLTDITTRGMDALQAAVSLKFLL
jgi:hypothetical protein